MTELDSNWFAISGYWLTSQLIINSHNGVIVKPRIRKLFF